MGGPIGREICAQSSGTGLRLDGLQQAAAYPVRYWRLSAVTEARESDMMSEMQVHVIARQMLEKHGFSAIAQAAQKAQDSERKGDSEDATEWRHIEAAMKIMRGPHQS
jgi:hypothetical protein